MGAGVEICLYRKGFVHAKTPVVDKKISIVGATNMDYRSFELNFEVNAIVYDDDLGRQLSEVFFENLNDAEKINAVKWINGAWHKQMFEKTAGLVSPLL